MSAGSNAVLYAFLSAGAALIVILVGLGIVLVGYQRRFVALHRAHAEGLLKAQETERAWVAREVHDDALQRIMLLQHELDEWSGSDRRPAADAERVAALRAELEDLSLVLRRMAYRLHPAFVQEEGLVAMLERLAADVSRAGGVDVEVRGMTAAPLLSADQALTVYRIAQEALRNVVQHAASRNAVVEVSRNNGSLEMCVRDFGRGFDVGVARGSGLGLLSMSERARSAGGMLSVTSHAGEGTRVQLRLPVSEA